VRWILVVLVLAVAGCGPSTVDSAPARAGSCLPVASVAASGAPSGTRLPDLSLECFEGGGVVRLTELHRPAIVNLWASWCGPCRTELPAFQSYATRHAGQVAVIGVDTSDTRSAGAALLQDVKVSFPNLFDPQGRLLSAVGRTALPVTLFVDAGGGLRYVYNSTALDEAGIARLADSQLGVAG
jgi:thiol-disulfide isomerase/thioredoxin